MPTSNDQHKENRPGETGRPETPQGKTPAFPANPVSKPAARGAHAASQARASQTGTMRPAAHVQDTGRRRAGAQGGVPSGEDRATVTLTRGQFIAALVGAAVAAAVPAVSITSCVTRMGQIDTGPVEEPWVSPYDWECVVEKENGLLAYVKNGVTLSEAGIDVSQHDGEIDWAQVKAAGVDFAMIRLGFRGYGHEGTMNLDNYFLANLSGASAAGLKVGVYFFSQAISAEEAREEADYVINNLSATDVALSYPVVFDEEPITDGNVARTDNMTAAQFSANALAFCQQVEKAGYTPMLYGNQHELAKLDLKGELAAYDVWYAEYGVKRPTGQFDFVMWQYSATGSIPGITTSAGQVDLNIRFLEA